MGCGEQGQEATGAGEIIDQEARAQQEAALVRWVIVWRKANPVPDTQREWDARADRILIEIDEWDIGKPYGPA